MVFLGSVFVPDTVPLASGEVVASRSLFEAEAEVRAWLRSAVAKYPPRTKDGVAQETDCAVPLDWHIDGGLAVELQ